MGKNITKEVTNVSIELAENGFVVEYSGRNDNDDWVSTKKLFTKFDDLCDQLSYIHLQLSEYRDA